MSHATFTAATEDWLIGKALGAPDIRSLFERLCDRLHGFGIPLDRAALSWPTLHPLFRAEQVFWRRGSGAELEQYYHSSAGNEHWLKSPFFHMITHDLDYMRRRLTGDDALVDFEVLEDFRRQGFTDYLLTATNFQIAEVEEFSGGRAGIMASFATKRDGGFTEDDLEALSRIQRVFAVACRASIQGRVMGNIASAYLGPTAGKRVLKGDIKLGDGERLRAVVWFSDLRGSTRLSDTMDPDSYLALLNHYFECTAGAVIENGGEILTFIGDGVLAIFPMSTECPIAAAAQAEAAVHEAIRRGREAERTGTPGGAPLRFGIGLAVGEVMYGNIGVPARLAFSGIGKVVNAVQRIESETKKLEIPVLASPDFAAAVDSGWVSAGEIEIRDFDRRLEVFTPPEFAKPDAATPSGIRTTAAE